MASSPSEDALSLQDELKMNFSCSELWSEPSLYEVLEVCSSASLEEIKASWRRLVKVSLGNGPFSWFQKTKSNSNFFTSQSNTAGLTS